jgi:protein phosphatase
MRIEIEALCQKGLVRENNEDAVSVGGQILRDNESSCSVTPTKKGFFYLLLADGMGGHEHGEEASEYTLKTIKELFSNRLMSADTFEEDLSYATRNISFSLNCAAVERGQHLPMGCTLTGLIWFYGHTWLVNAGDSRTYRYRGGLLRQLTTDETERGMTGNPDAQKYLLNCIGGGLDGSLTIENMDGKLLTDDIILICSDGLTDMLSDDQIEKAITNGTTAADLYRMACEAGGIDNVSIILARIK